jgi:hypothetical protein
MPGPSRTPLLLLIAGLVAISAPAAADAQSVIHACYVPLTGTVYRIKEPGLRTACSSSTHVEFSWTDGDGALRPTGASKGNVLQFDGTQWQTVNPQSLGLGGVTGYEIVTATATNSYTTPSAVIVSVQWQACLLDSCAHVTYFFRTMAPPVTTTLACPAGKKAFGVFAPNTVGTDILADGRVNVTIPQLQRDGPQQQLTLQPNQPPNASTLPNQIPSSPQTKPDGFPVKLVCANAS